MTPDADADIRKAPRRLPAAVAHPDASGWLSPEAMELAHFAVTYYAAETGRRDGLSALRSASPLVRDVLAACEASMRLRRASGSGQPFRTFDEEPPESPPSRPDDLLTMTQTARELEVDERTARRLAHRGELGRITLAGRAMLARRFEVDACRNRRSETR